MTATQPERRLAAIVSADVVGYSRMMGAHEVLTLEKVKALRRKIIEPCAKRRRGRLFKTTGDGFLLEFPSVFDAFEFACSVQAGLRSRKGEAEPLKLRIGINVGDIILDDGDVFGDGVNIAARLEPLAPIGGLCVSQRAYDDLRRLGLPFECTGEQQLKNIHDPIRIYALNDEQLAALPHEEEPADTPIGFRERGLAADVARAGSHQENAPVSRALFSRRAALGGGAAAAAAAALGGWTLLKPRSSGASHSIAVLPFADLSGDPSQAHFAAGIAGEIRNTLTRVGGLKVAGSTSSDAVREDDAQTAAKKLGVANILTGNVRRTPSKIRVTAELIDGSTGLTKWSQNYDRAPGDVIMIQTDIARSVARALAIALSASARTALAAGETSNIAAQTLVFQARNMSYQLTVPALRQSLRLLDKAISIDPGYARAYAMKSFVANNLASQTAKTPAELAQGRSQALDYGQTALSIAPDLPIAHSALGFAYALTLQVNESLRAHRTALSLASGDPDVIRNYGFVASSLGRSDEALRHVDEALGLDPLNWASHYAHVLVLFNARRYEDAVRYSLKLKRESPDLFRFPDLLGHSLLMLGRREEAALAFGQNRMGQALLAASSGNRELALAHVAALKERSGEFRSFFSAAFEDENISVVRVRALLGEKDAAFEALDRAWDVRDSNLLELKVDPYLDPLRGDPRFTALVRKIGLPT